MEEDVRVAREATWQGSSSF